ncbi:hypothetical protein V495_03189 [Pseudogymnoascus sp. VKM F-4514 (FW-929)]|nr:hypothetical protein V495_03189 [Pseudogymnoascus sp. VKM F-4514 (FW-929)]
MTLIANTDLEKLRPAGRLERYFMYCHDLGLYLNVGATGYYSCSNPPSLSLQSIIYAALATVLAQHPVLSTVFVSESSSNVFYSRLPAVDLTHHVNFIRRQQPYDGVGRDIELDELLEKQHNTKFEQVNGATPCWRLMILTDQESLSSGPKFAATYVSHHSISDGMSVMAFHKSFLTALKTASNVPLSSTVVTSQKVPMLPSLDTAIKLPISAKYMAKALYSEVFASRPKGLWTGEPTQVVTATHFQSRVISADRTSAFAAQCKKNQTTVTAALQTLVAATLFELLPPQFTRLNTEVSVSLRRWLKDPIDALSLGMWLATYEDPYERRQQAQDFSWDEARRSRQLALEFLAREGRDSEIGMMRFLPDIESYCKSRIGKKRDKSFEVSSVGVHDHNKEERDDGTSDIQKGDATGNKWRIGRMIFSQSSHAPASAITVSVVTGADGCCVLGFTWQEGSVSKEMVEKLIDLVPIKILELSGPVL